MPATVIAAPAPAPTAEWASCNEPWRVFRKRWGYGKLPVGLQFEIDKETYLIGDTNQLGGACDHCDMFDGNDIVTRFRQLIKTT